MTYDYLNSEFEKNNKIKFKLYSLDYLIEKEGSFIQVYAVDYPTRKSKYDSFKEAMNSFKVYNEPLIEQLDRVTIINQGNEDYNSEDY